MEHTAASSPSSHLRQCARQKTPCRAGRPQVVAPVVSMAVHARPGCLPVRRRRLMDTASAVPSARGAIAGCAPAVDERAAAAPARVPARPCPRLASEKTPRERAHTSTIKEATRHGTASTDGTSGRCIETRLALSNLRSRRPFKSVMLTKRLHASQTATSAQILRRACRLTAAGPPARARAAPDVAWVRETGRPASLRLR
jgi:hypothetical protein